MAPEETKFDSDPANRDGWATPLPEKVARPTYAPAALALGIAFVLFGIATSYLFCAAGGLIMAFSLKNWIAEMADGD